MKKIVIISYFFPPSKKPANRTYSWYKYFPKQEYYPIILTMSQDSNSSLEINNFGEVHRISAPMLFNEKLAKKKLPSIIKLVINKIYNSIFLYSKFNSTYRAFDSYFQERLKNDCDLLIISGSPFNLFRVGYNYSKKQHGKWVADYRDLWNNSEMPREFDNFIEKGIRAFFTSKLEKKWAKSSQAVVTVSDYLSVRLGKYLQEKVSVIENGYFDDEHSQFIDCKKFDTTSFVYVGTMYKTQRLDKTIISIGEGLERRKTEGEFYFIGTSLNRNMRKFIQSYKSSYLTIKLLPKITKNECLQIQSKCHYGIMCSYGVKGIPASKLYEYLGLKQKVFCYPSDEDVIEETLYKSGLGYSFSKHEEAVNWVSSQEYIPFQLNNDQEAYLKSFTRFELAKKYVNTVIKPILN